MQDLNTTGAVVGTVWGLSMWALLSYFWMTTEMIVMLSVFLGIDFILWVFRAWQADNTEVKSSLMAKGLFRKLTRWLFPFIVIGAAKFGGITDPTALTYPIVGILIVSEAYSSIRHIYNINTGKDLSEIDAFGMLIEKIWGMIWFTIKKLISLVEGGANEKKEG